ncbi:4Fe-4S binding protein [Alkaliphilus serpentinus]|uniref:4Fe-4S binding protein n=1 Tax=Alkaliphilus serpentinus TaxID=1482731 RepID=A0A833M6S4_9FIRM|nr:4Fe-4S binding protein [Alkaliphilus serpentinus]KAB3524826.1 4Fe-4S binding protein [Alkaliphilus serpentinus]
MKDINYYIKTNRVFTPIRKYGWFFTVLVAIGGLWEPKLGLLVLFIMAGLTITAFFTGRYWCGNFCPHGSLFDVLLTPLSTNRKIPKILKSKIMIIGFFGFFMWNFSRKVFKVLGIWGSLQFWDRLGFVFVTTYLMVLITGGLLAIFVNSRTWCQFCPMGTIQKLSYGLGKVLGVVKKTDKKVTILDKELCHLCGKCSRVCPFQLTPYLEFSDHNQFDNINCIRCATCVENCPAGILSIGTEKETAKLIEDLSLEGYKNRQKIKAKISAIRDFNKDVKEYVFTFATPSEVAYKAGQFILVKIQDEPKAYRAYSISSYNEDNKTLNVIIKKVDKGYGTDIIFNKFKVGDFIELEGPMGDELVLDRAADKLLFIGNGIGITPFIALAKDAVLNQSVAQFIKLLQGQRYEEDFIYDEYFKDLDKNYDQFQYISVASRPKNKDQCKGYVTDLLKEMDLKGYKVYMCGSKKMIIDSYDILVKQGVKKEDIYYESEEKIKGIENHPKKAATA